MRNPAPRRRLLLVANTSWFLFNFNLAIGKAAQLAGYDVVMVAPPDIYAGKIRDSGFRFIPVNISRKGINPFREFWTIVRLMWIYARERPALVHHFTIKCVLYGTIAAWTVRVPGVVNSITGLGHVFLTERWRTRWIRPLVKCFYKHVLGLPSVHTLFLNPDDRETFLRLGLVKESRTFLIRGPGVNMSRFTPERCARHVKEPVVLFASRLLVEKGILDFVEAARIVRRMRPGVVFEIAGECDSGNPSSISAETIEAWQREGDVKLLGHVESIEDALSNAALVVLPSYREGIPKILLEASAMCRPIVATDVPGCRDVVVHGVTGLLVPVRDARALATSVVTLLDDPVRCEALGKAAREKVKLEFSDHCVISATLELYRKAATHFPA